MGEFNAADIIYNVMAAVGTDVMIYKDRSEVGLTNERIVIDYLQLNEPGSINKVSVNINIFVPWSDKNGMLRRQRMKELKHKMRESPDSINNNDGVCKEVTVLWSIPILDLKGKFACTNIRLEILIGRQLWREK